MKIALDYDGTYTADPHLWDNFIKLAAYRGHEVRVVTLRHPEIDNIRNEKIYPQVVIHYTNGEPKRGHKELGDWEPDVWIDDSPHGILHGSSLTEEGIIAWRKNGRK